MMHEDTFVDLTRNNPTQQDDLHDDLSNQKPESNILNGERVGKIKENNDLNYNVGNSGPDSRHRNLGGTMRKPLNYREETVQQNDSAFNKFLHFAYFGGVVFLASSAVGFGTYEAFSQCCDLAKKPGALEFIALTGALLTALVTIAILDCYRKSVISQEGLER